MVKMTINIASVKVMRSYDYCHFEVNLAANVDCPPDSPESEWFKQVDNLRKNAARLADRAVAQYKVSKAAHQAEESSWDSMRYAAKNAERMPEAERTPEDKAAIKALADARFALEQRYYDYQDDWDDQDS